MTNSRSEIPQLSEFGDNLFISRLPPQMSMHQALTFLDDPPAFKPEERL